MSEANLLFQSGLRINYDKTFISTAQSFVENLAKTSGANDKECFHLNMVVEEVLSFIIDKFPDDRYENFIDVNFSLTDDSSINIEMTNFGPPIHITQIPEFNIDNDATVEGLWYKMAKNMVDEIRFINRKNDGWLIRFVKKIETRSFEKNITLVEEQEITRNLTSRIAVVDDAEQLIDLAYNTYRYSYGVSDYYDVDLLRKNIKDGHFFTFVVENENKIIGAVSIKHYKNNPAKAELGAAMVMPEYRSSTAGMRLFKEEIQYHKDNPDELELFETFSVTTHVVSQKFVLKIHNGYWPFAVLLAITPGPNFVNIDNRLGVRETLLQSYYLCGPIKREAIYATKQNKEIIEEIFANTGNVVNVLVEENNSNSSEVKTIIETESSPDVYTVFLKSFGTDWFAELHKQIFLLKPDHTKAIVLQVNTDNPLPVDFDDKLADLNLIFVGLTLESLSKIDLCYKLISEPINFDVINLHNEVGIKLLQHIKQRYEEVLLSKI